MKSEIYFLLSLVFAVVAGCCLVMPTNPLYMTTGNNEFIFGHILGEQRITIYYSALTFCIFLPSVYFALGFLVAGIVKVLWERYKTSILST